MVKEGMPLQQLVNKHFNHVCYFISIWTIQIEIWKMVLFSFSFMQGLDSFKQNNSHLNYEDNNNISLSQRADYENKLDAQMLWQRIQVN